MVETWAPMTPCFDVETRGLDGPDDAANEGLESVTSTCGWQVFWATMGEAFD